MIRRDHRLFPRVRWAVGGTFGQAGLWLCSNFGKIAGFTLLLGAASSCILQVSGARDGFNVR